MLAVSIAGAAPLDAQIRGRLDSGAAARAHWGVFAMNLETGQVVADVNGGRLFVPASTRKLVSSAMAHEFIGPGAVLETVIHASGLPRDGVVEGDLVVRAAGDPSWKPAARGGRPGRTVLRSLAEEVAGAGVERVTGDLVIDTSLWPDPEPLPSGWEWDDFQTLDGAIPSVFGIDGNTAGVSITPASPGDPVRVSLSGAESALRIINNTRTTRAGTPPNFRIFRDLTGDEVVFSGTLPADSGTSARSVALPSPVLFAARQFEEILEDEGITIEGGIRLSSERIGAAHLVALQSSPTIGELMALSNQPSDNHLAESLYLAAGAEVFGQGSWQAARQAEERLWSRVGVEGAAWEGVDGSGLSRRNLLTPEALVALLEEMAEEPAFVESLARSGHSGTLRYRLTEEGLAGDVYAKTGTLTGVSALAGYLQAPSGTIAFAIFANNYTSSATPIRSAIDDVVGILDR